MPSPWICIDSYKLSEKEDLLPTISLPYNEEII